MMNPFLPCNVFIPDGEPRVFGNRVYVYGSHDIYGGTAMCTGDYQVWSAALDDLQNFKLEGTCYERMQDPYIRAQVEAGKGTMFNQFLYAPDVICLDGKYYMYYGVAMSGAGIGVAVSDNPTGPFTYVGRVRYPKEAIPEKWEDTEDGIADGDMAMGKGVPMLQLNPFKKHFGIHMKGYPYDPALLYDDGHLYMYFGCTHCHVAELDVSDKRTLVKNKTTGLYFSESVLPAQSEKDKIAAQDGWSMANGPSIRKIDDTYYLSYYAVNKNGCNAMCYSTSQSPWGPFTYQGVLVSLGNGRSFGQTVPTAYGGNTHGGMFEVEGRYYQIYHRQTGDPNVARQGCMQELVLQEDGTFRQAEYMSQVQAEGGLQLPGSFPAYTACVLTDKNSKTKKKSASPYFTLKEYEHGVWDETTGKKVYQMVTNLTDGARVGYKYFVFDTEKDAMSISVTLRNTADGKIDVYLDNNKKADATILLTAQQGVKEFEGTLHIPTDGLRHAVYFVFYGQKKDTEFVQWEVKS